MWKAPAWQPTRAASHFHNRVDFGAMINTVLTSNMRTVAVKASTKSVALRAKRDVQRLQALIRLSFVQIRSVVANLERLVAQEEQ